MRVTCRVDFGFVRVVCAGCGAPSSASLWLATSVTTACSGGGRGAFSTPHHVSHTRTFAFERKIFDDVDEEEVAFAHRRWGLMALISTKGPPMLVAPIPPGVWPASPKAPEVGQHTKTH